MILIPYFDLYKQYLEHSECRNFFDDDQCRDILSNIHSLDSLDISWNTQLEFHQRMATSIRTKTFMFDCVFGKTCVHKVRNHTRIFTPYGKYYLKNGEIYESNDEQENNKVTSLPIPFYSIEYERHTYRRHPHSSLELSIDILTKGDPKKAHKLLSGQSFSNVFYDAKPHSLSSKQSIWIMDYFFETRNNPSELDVHRELDHFITASNYQ